MARVSLCPCITRCNSSSAPVFSLKLPGPGTLSDWPLRLSPLRPALLVTLETPLKNKWTRLKFRAGTQTLNPKSGKDNKRFSVIEAIAKKCLKNKKYAWSFYFLRLPFCICDPNIESRVRQVTSKQTIASRFTEPPMRNIFQLRCNNDDWEWKCTGNSAEPELCNQQKLWSPSLIL